MNLRPDHPAHPGRCGTDRHACLLAYAASGDIQRDFDFEYRVVGTDRIVTAWVYAHAEEEAEPGVPTLLTLTYDGRVGLTAEGEQAIAAGEAAAEPQPGRNIRRRPTTPAPVRFQVA